MNEDKHSIEDKRRKNILDNQKFLESLNLVNVLSIFYSTRKKCFSSCSFDFRYVMNLKQQSKSKLNQFEKRKFNRKRDFF